MWKDFKQKKEERHRSCHLSRPVSAGLNLQPKHYLDTLADPHLRSCISSVVATFADEPHLVLPLQCWGTRLSAPHHDDLLTTLLILRLLHHHTLVWWYLLCGDCMCAGAAIFDVNVLLWGIFYIFLYILYVLVKSKKWCLVQSQPFDNNNEIIKHHFPSGKKNGLKVLLAEGTVNVHPLLFAS